jgi:N-acetylglucosamine malate deacetylase 1
MMNSFRRVLVLAPHTDDAELGCGGTIAKMVEAGQDVFVAAFSTAEDSLPPGKPADTLKREFRAAMPVLGVNEDRQILFGYKVRHLSYSRQEVLEDIIRLREEVEPDLVLLPSGMDLHQDHQVVYMEGLRAFKHISVLGYELPWNHIRFDAQAFSILQRHHIDKKWQALQAYETQIELQRLYFTTEFIEGLARVRGTQVKESWAEAFEVLRLKW